MKKLSIKARIVIWYTLAIVLLIALFLATVVVSTKRIAQSELRNVLTMTVNNYCATVEAKSAEAMQGARDEFDDDVPHSAGKPKRSEPNSPEKPPSSPETEYIFSEEDISAITDCVILVYDVDGALLYGTLNGHYADIGNLSFNENELKEAETEKGEFYVYTKALKTKKRTVYWVRGIIDATEAASDAKSYLWYAITLPIFALLALAIGFRITKHAFKPVDAMNSTAKAIGESKDFSHRIEIGNSDDELASLSKTFNLMLSQIEETFIAEKQFTDDASHELRTPVSVILSQCEYAMENELSPEEAKASFGVINNQAQKMSSLISQLLTFARIDRGAEYIARDELDLSELIEIVAAELQYTAEKRNITVNCDIQPGITFVGDQNLLTRLFINLITNAIKFGKDGGKIDISLRAEKEKIVCKIADDGIGIPHEHIDKIWERFYQVDPSRASVRRGGSGLGLSMAKWIAEAHGGTITVESAVDVGSTFTVSLPTC